MKPKKPAKPYMTYSEWEEAGEKYKFFEFKSKKERPTQKNATIECKAMEIYDMGYEDAISERKKKAKENMEWLNRVRKPKGFLSNLIYNAHLRMVGKNEETARDEAQMCAKMMAETMESFIQDNL